MEITTLRVKKQTKERLSKLKVHHRETDEEALVRLIEEKEK